MLICQLKFKFKNKDPLTILAHLYTENNIKSIEYLKSCRINPNFLTIKQARDDLEFYIPQLWLKKQKRKKIHMQSILNFINY